MEAVEGRTRISGIRMVPVTSSTNQPISRSLTFAYPSRPCPYSSQPMTSLIQRAEVQELVAEFMSGGMRRSEFCRSRRLSLGTLNRHLKEQSWKRKSRVVSSVGRLSGHLFLFCNGQRNRLKAILSVVESWRRLRVPVRDYFSTILPRARTVGLSQEPQLPGAPLGGGSCFSRTGQPGRL